MVRRVVIALLTPVPWTPPGIEPADWRSALVEDVVDLLATLNEVEVALAATAADQPLAETVRWPGMPSYLLPEAAVNDALAAATADGYDQA
ncbi:MAG TPA: hypothetical protein VGD43_04355, partial [Micromonospora sp.]